MGRALYRLSCGASRAQETFERLGHGRNTKLARAVPLMRRVHAPPTKRTAVLPSACQSVPLTAATSSSRASNFVFNGTSVVKPNRHVPLDRSAAATRCMPSATSLENRRVHTVPWQASLGSHSDAVRPPQLSGTPPAVASSLKNVVVTGVVVSGPDAMTNVRTPRAAALATD